MASDAPHAFSLRQLQYAVAVDELLSFRKAAARCHVSQPSLSAQLAQLETALGVRLFERDRRTVVATPAGKEVVGRARALLLAADDLLVTAQRFVDPLEGTLRLGVIPTISPYLLPAVTPRLHKAFGKLSVAWVEDRTSALVSALHAGRLDGALLALEADLGDVDHDVIGKDPFVLVAAPDHPLAKKTSAVTAADLAGSDVLLLDDGHCFRTQALEVCSRLRAHELEFRATSLTTLVQMVAGGSAVTLLPALALATELKRSNLRVRKISMPTAERTLALVWRKGSPVGAALHEVAGVVRDAWRSAQ